MKAHSVRLSIVKTARSSRAKLADHRTLNEATEAVPGIVKQPVFVAPHISSIFISSFFMSLFILCLLCV